MSLLCQSIKSTGFCINCCRIRLIPLFQRRFNTFFVGTACCWFFCFCFCFYSFRLQFSILFPPNVVVWRTWGAHSIHIDENEIYALGNHLTIVQLYCLNLISHTHTHMCRFQGFSYFFPYFFRVHFSFAFNFYFERSIAVMSTNNIL